MNVASSLTYFFIILTYDNEPFIIFADGYYIFLCLCRWIIQKAFYYPKTVGRCGCSGISWRDLFLFCPTCHKPITKALNPKQALKLDDFEDVSPTYIGCATINRWRRTLSPREAHYEVLTMTPDRIERLDRAPEDEELHGKLMPMDLYLSDSAATSAAAIDHDMGGKQGDEAPFRDIKVMLGLSVGASVLTDKRHEEKRRFCIQVILSELKLFKNFSQNFSNLTMTILLDLS